MSGGSEGSGGQLARTSSHYMGPVGSEALTQHWVQHGWADAGHVMNRYISSRSLLADARPHTPPPDDACGVCLPLSRYT